MKKGKVLLVLSVAMVTMFGSVLPVSAAAPSYAGIFDAEYYGEKYSDLAAAFGDDEEALYNHYINYGIYEGRSCSVVFDVQNYRESYSDLNNVFGDDWKSYLDHYLTYGLSEGRDGGGMFDAVSYANRYEDLKEAFGYDVTKLWAHYEQFGVSEGRNAVSQAVMNQWEAESAQVNSDTYTRTYIDEYNCKIVEEVVNGVLRKLTGYDPVDGYLAVIYNYNSQGKVTEWINYNSEGDVVYLEVYSYNADGLLAEKIATSYVENCSFCDTYEYDEYGRISTIKTEYQESGKDAYVYYTDYYYDGTSDVVVRTEQRTA